jgi:hypothetical protein
MNHLVSPNSHAHVDSHSHVDPLIETCPTCDQPIANERAEEIRARAAAMEKRLAAEAEARAAAKIEAAKLEGQRAAQAQIAAAEKAKAAAEDLAAQKVAAAEEAAAAKIQQIETERDSAIEVRVRDALAKSNSEHDEKMRKLLEHAQMLERKLAERRANELGEGAHIRLLDVLKEEFPDDNIRRIQPGVSGADILHTIMRNGVACGSILYESKNAMAWRDDYVTKLLEDQTAAKADHAVLATFKFPKDATQVEIRESVIIVNPARAVAIAQILRKHLLYIHGLRLSKNERQGKMAQLYDFMTSERYASLMGRVDSESGALLELQEMDKRHHQRHWQKEGQLIRSIQNTKVEIDTAVELIVGGHGPDGEVVG